MSDRGRNPSTDLGHVEEIYRDWKVSPPLEMVSTSVNGILGASYDFWDEEEEYVGIIALQDFLEFPHIIVVIIIINNFWLRIACWPRGSYICGFSHKERFVWRILLNWTVAFSSGKVGSTIEGPDK